MKKKISSYKEKQKILIVGDFKGNTGPASVNKTIKKLHPEIIGTYKDGKITRIIEMILKIIISEYIVFSGLSKLNLIGFKISKILGKKSAYLMHGYSKIESEFENTGARIDLEYTVIKNASKVICVSKLFMNEMKLQLPQFKEKFYYIMNPIDINTFKKNESIKRDTNLIMSVGGGLKQKNILKICEAIDSLNNEKGTNFKLLVIGKECGDIEKIKSYNFVTYKKRVPYKKMSEYYSKCNLYIQNSLFETFGLAPIEALSCGANILISDKCGCKDALKINHTNIIYENFNKDEISSKILNNMKNEFKEKIQIKTEEIDNFKSNLKFIFDDMEKNDEVFNR